jgi:2-dehydropantoate 2-reductase
MNEINNVLICGLGAIGTIYAEIIKRSANLKVLVDENRLEKYKNNPIIFNGQSMEFDYILPTCKDFKADLVIIATKYDGFFDAVKNIKNFVGDNTVIISLLNGVTSEKYLVQEYGKEKVLYSYFIGHSSVMNGRSIVHDGVNKIVFGSPSANINVERVKNFFNSLGINYEIPEDIIYSLWLKFVLNVSCNQISAVKGYTFGDIQSSDSCMKLVINVMKEVIEIAKAEGVNNTDNLLDDALKALNIMSPDGKTSMLQDVEAGRKTEVDIFAGVVTELGKKHGIKTPHNEALKLAIENLTR